MLAARPHILDLSHAQLQELLAALGEKPFRAAQLMSWIYKKQAASFDEMSDLPAALRDKLKAETVLFSLEPLQEWRSKDGQTLKLLFRLEDGQTIESTLMYYKRSDEGRERRTVCLSTQVGCAVGCGFCATGQQGFVRNLAPGEIVGQVLYFARLVKGELEGQGEGRQRNWITNVVLMGMGEPLANYENVKQAVGILNSPEGLNLGIRQITLSTSGLAPQVRRLADDGLKLELAISLHAANDALRDRLVPVNRKYPIAELIAAAKYYFEVTGRRPTFEYALFKGLNDSLADAEALVKLLADFNCAVNLIVGNPTDSQDFQPSGRTQALAFQKRLIEGGLRTMIRVSKGADIEAGCGQLRSRGVG